jgi:uncharacterized protein (DUF58 family)
MPLSPLLDPETIQRAEQLGIQAKQIVEGYMAGGHHSPFRGFAVEFAQHREYVAGDDLRHLDWKVLGRTDRYYIKQYEQETNFVAHLLVDVSESMKYTSAERSKLDYARVGAACLAHLILMQRDAVAVGLFDSTLREYLPRTNNLDRIHAICTALTQIAATEKTSIGTVLGELALKVRRRGIAVIFSDLLDDEESILRGLHQLRFSGHEVIVFHVLDRYEIEFPFRNSVEFRGLEGQGRLRTRPAEIRSRYLAEFNAYLERVRVGCERQGCSYLRVPTDRPWADVLTAWLATR